MLTGSWWLKVFGNQTLDPIVLPISRYSPFLTVPWINGQRSFGGTTVAHTWGGFARSFLWGTQPPLQSLIPDMKISSGLVAARACTSYCDSSWALLHPAPPVLPFSGCGCQGVPSLDAYLFCLKDTMLCFHNSLQIKTLCLSLSLADQYSRLASNGEAPPTDLYYW